jgi:hypothetical protein
MFFWHFLVLKSQMFSPSWLGGGKNLVLVYSLFDSFIEDLDIDEFNKFFGTL